MPCIERSCGIEGVGRGDVLDLAALAALYRGTGMLGIGAALAANARLIGEARGLDADPSALVLAVVPFRRQDVEP